MVRSGIVVAGVALALVAPMATGQGAQQMTFFVTSTGAGRGADLGGLAGADGHCQTLAAAAGAGSHTWHAYLSTSGTDGVNARERIGSGPWQNAKGEVIARNVAELHGRNNLTKQTALTERGEMVKGRGDTPNQHDILTGSQMDGTAFGSGEDTTCGNWTRGGADGRTWVGHVDRMGLSDDEAARSWNSSHATRGCSQENLVSTGGAGLLYCFAVR